MSHMSNILFLTSISDRICIMLEHKFLVQEFLLENDEFSIFLWLNHLTFSYPKIYILMHSYSPHFDLNGKKLLSTI